MELTYTATLLGNRLEWRDNAPPSALSDLPLTVHVTILDAQTALEQTQLRGQHMADILTRMAAKAPFASIADPAAWEREMRTDRLLPERE